MTLQFIFVTVVTTMTNIILHTLLGTGEYGASFNILLRNRVPYTSLAHAH